MSWQHGGQSRMADVRYLTLYEMLLWTYRQQKAHRYLKRPMDWFLWAISTYDLIEDSPRPTVDSDAAVLHAAVVEMSHSDAEIIVYHAATGSIPEVCSAPPAPHPVGRGARNIFEGDDWHWASIRGRRTEYLTRVSEIIALREPVLRRVGKRKSKVVGYRHTPFECRFCPLDWSPDPRWVELCAGVHRTWLAAMQKLFETVKAVEFNAHVITAIGIDENETAPETVRLDTGKKITSADVMLEKGRLIFHDEATAFRRWARARSIG